MLVRKCNVRNIVLVKGLLERGTYLLALAKIGKLPLYIDTRFDLLQPLLILSVLKHYTLTLLKPINKV